MRFVNRIIPGVGRLGVPGSAAVSWGDDLNALFDDLEQQAEALYDAERFAELADRTRSEYAAVTLASRLMASVGRRLVVSIRGIGLVEGTLRRVGDGWCWLVVSGHDWLIRTAALDRISGASDRSVPELAWSPVDRLKLGSALRRLAGSPGGCVVYQVDEAAHEGQLGRVGKDFVELEVPCGAPQLVPFASIAGVRSRE
jgi:hypothetical protein